MIREEKKVKDIYKFLKGFIKFSELCETEAHSKSTASAKDSVPFLS